MKKLSLLFALSALAAAASAQVAYSNTVESGSRYNPNAATVTPNAVTLDDVIIPDTSTGTVFAVKKITYGIRRLANAGAINVESFVAGFDDFTTGLATAPISLGTQSLAANGATSVTQSVVFGNGTSTLALVPLVKGTDGNAGFSSFSAGLRFSGANGDFANNGWRIVARPASGSLTGQTGFSDDLFVSYDTTTNTQGLGYFGGVTANTTNLPGSFYMVIEGSVQAVPEPAAFAPLALGVVALVRRRKRA